MMTCFMTALTYNGNFSPNCGHTSRTRCTASCWSPTIKSKDCKGLVSKVLTHRVTKNEDENNTYLTINKKLFYN